MHPCQVCAKSAGTCCSRCKVAYFCSSHCQNLAWRIHKHICKRLASLSPVPSIPSQSSADSDSQSRAVVLIIGALVNGFHEREEDLLIELQRRSAIVVARDIITSIAGLDLKPQAILLVDDLIVQPEWRSVLLRVIDAAKVYGCRLVIGGDLPGFTQRLDDLFKTLRVPWRHKDYFRTDFNLSSSCTAPFRETAGLAKLYSMKATHLDGVSKADAVYLPPPGATLQSAVFLQEPVAGRAGCGAAYMKYGKGWLGFSGDNNSEGASTKLLLVMCGLTLEDCTLPDQAASISTRFSSGAGLSYSGASGMTSPPDPNRPTIASDVDFWLRHGIRMSTDTTPRQSRWDPNRDLGPPLGFPGTMGFS